MALAFTVSIYYAVFTLTYETRDEARGESVNPAFVQRYNTILYFESN